MESKLWLQISEKLPKDASHFLTDYQCDQTELFLKGLGDKMSYKSSPKIWRFGLFLKASLFEVKTAATSFWATFVKDWTNFYSKIWTLTLTVSES